MNESYAYGGFGQGLSAVPLLELKDRDDYVAYHIRRTFSKTQSMFEWNRLPDTIPQRTLELMIQYNIYSTIAEKDGKLYALYGALGGIPDYNYMPTLSIIENPYLKFNKALRIGKDCVVIKNDDCYLGLLPLIKYFATQMAENDISLSRVRVNTRALFAFLADNDTARVSAEKFLKELEDGKSGGVIMDKTFKERIDALPLSEHSAAQNIIQLLEDKQYIKGSLLNELGVQSNYNMKRETITANENILNVDGLLPLCDNMLKCRQEGAKQVNEMFGTNWSVDFSSAWKKLRREIEISEERNFGESNKLDNNEKLNAEDTAESEAENDT